MNLFSEVHSSTTNEKKHVKDIKEKTSKDAKVILKSNSQRRFKKSLKTKKKASSYTCTKSQCSHTRNTAFTSCHHTSRKTR
jgi:hypothetical protein